MSELLGAVDAWDALRHRCAAAVGERDIITAEGPDTVSFLQGQLSQDVAEMVVGDVRWSLHLQPQGKVIAVVRLTRLSQDAVLIDTDPGAGADVFGALSRFKIRTKCELTLKETVRSTFVRGPQAPAEALPLDAVFPTVSELVAGAPITLAAAPWAGPGYDIIATAESAPHGTARVDADVFEAYRIFSGVPRHGFEIVDGPIPVETGLVPFTVAFGKGCYVGQELVERLDSRNRQIRRLIGIDLPSGPVPTMGASVFDEDGKAVGSLTSAAIRPDTGSVVALAMVRNTVEAGSTLLVDGVEAITRPLDWQ